MAGEKFTDDERAGLSDAELAVLDGGADDDAENLKAVAGNDDDDAGQDDKGGAKGKGDDRTDDEKAADALKAKEDADRKAKEEAEDKARAAAEKKVKDAADAAAEAAKKAGQDEAAQKLAREEAEKKAREEAEQAGSTEEPADTGDDEEPVDEFQPPYVAPKPDKYDERMADFDKREDAVTAKFKAGDIELEEMQKQHRTIARERAKLEGEMQAHRITSELAEQQGAQRWKWEVNRFMRDVKKHEGIDYADSIRLNSALDVKVKALANDPKNADKPGEWFLREAHKQVKAELGIGDKGVAPSKEQKSAAAKAKEEADRKAKEAAAAKRAAASGKDKLPKTVGDLPAAGAADIGKDGEGEFAEAQALLEKGDSMALEAYIAGKSPEWQDRWARQ